MGQFTGSADLRGTGGLWLHFWGFLGLWLLLWGLPGIGQLVSVADSIRAGRLHPPAFTHFLGHPLALCSVRSLGGTEKTVGSYPESDEHVRF